MSQDTKCSGEVFKKCMEEFVRTESNTERKICVIWKGEGELSNFRLYKVKSGLEDDAWELNTTVTEMYLPFTLARLHNSHLDILKLLKRSCADVSW